MFAGARERTLIPERQFVLKGHAARESAFLLSSAIDDGHRRQLHSGLLKEARLADRTGKRTRGRFTPLWIQKRNRESSLPHIQATARRKPRESNPMRWKTCLIISGALVVAAFLLGFVPQYQKGKALENQLGAVQQQLNSERDKSQMDELGLLCGRVYLETNLKNYGLASQYSSKFFDQVQAMMNQTPDSSLQLFLLKTLAQRDAVTGGLAQGDPGILSAVQDLFHRTLEAAESGLK